ncbi:MAG: EF-P beta-lysylation protein EpmB, partial [Halioglobus sp.]
MSSRLPITELSSHWQEQLRTAVTSTPELLQLLDLREDQLDWLEGDTAGFALKVPHSFVRRMHRGDPDDPLLRQVLATPDEKLATPGYSTDPVGEQDNANPVPGLIHKYRGRLLLVVAGGCAVNCRYCFRRHFPYEDNRNGRRDWQAAYDYIRAQGDIEEVIFS